MANENNSKNKKQQTSQQNQKKNNNSGSNGNINNKAKIDSIAASVETISKNKDNAPLLDAIATLLGTLANTSSAHQTTSNNKHKQNLSRNLSTAKTVIKKLSVGTSKEIPMILINADNGILRSCLHTVDQAEGVLTSVSAKTAWALKQADEEAGRELFEISANYKTVLLEASEKISALNATSFKKEYGNFYDIEYHNKALKKAEDAAKEPSGKKEDTKPETVVKKTTAKKTTSSSKEEKKDTAA